MLYDLSMLKDAGIDPAKFIKCNNKFLQIQQDFLEELLEFVEKCDSLLRSEASERLSASELGDASERVADVINVNLFLVRTMENLTEYVKLVCAKGENE